MALVLFLFPRRLLFPDLFIECKRNSQAFFAAFIVLIDQENDFRRTEGLRPLSPSKIQILGQLSLLMDDKISTSFHLQATSDLDARLELEFSVKKKLQELLQTEGLVYDEDSPLIFLPKGSRELALFDFKNLKVTRIDPESALVSKALKAPQKNRILIIDVAGAEIFPDLIDRMRREGVNLDQFFKGEEE